MLKRGLFIVLIFGSLSLAGQIREEVVNYQKVIGPDLLIYDGMIAPFYVLPHNGTYYAYSQIYGHGVLSYNGIQYYDIVMNLNSYTNELYLKYSEYQDISIQVNKDFVESFSINERSFVKRGNTYYETLYEGDIKLYKYNIKRLEEKVLTIGVDRTFLDKSNYYLLIERGDRDEFFQISSINDLQKRFPEIKRELKRAVRDISKKRTPDEYYKALISFIDTNTR